MKVLVVGGGGREHAICWKLAQSPKIDELYCAPGNAGIADVAVCVNIGAEDIEGICGFASAEKIDLAVIGPEVPLAMGITDELQKRGASIGVIWQDGRPFHSPCGIRMNLALPFSLVEEAMERLRKYVFV